MTYKKLPLKALSFASVLVVSTLVLHPSAKADDSFLECIGNSADAGYPVPQPSPSDSEAPAPITSPPPVTHPSPVASTPVTNAPSPTGSGTATALISASPSPTSSSSGASIYGVFIRPEWENQGLLSADIYLLTPHGRWVKQIGHAEVDAPTAISGGVESSDSLTYQSDPSSPFAFQLTVSQGQATLNQAALFNGDNLSNLSLNCHGMRHGR